MIKNPDIFSSSIFIVDDISQKIANIKNSLPKYSVRVIRNEQSSNDEFLLDQSKLAIKESYIATVEKKYVLLCGASFRKEAQNALLKLLEEPPLNIVLIIITTSKSSLLPTVRSRLPLKYQKNKEPLNGCNLELKNLDLKTVYDLLKNNQKISKQEAKDFIQSLFIKLTKEKIKVSQKELDCFSTSIKLLELNSKPINVITTILLNIIHIKKIHTKRI